MEGDGLFAGETQSTCLQFALLIALGGASLPFAVSTEATESAAFPPRYCGQKLGDVNPLCLCDEQLPFGLRPVRWVRVED